ncbi:bromodomain-containing protein 7 isoform X1 [Rhinatrema bivittatum]|nr:bromodomain-containing protein 7 isoform X1 [Rhinatrema bivittatum]
MDGEKEHKLLTPVRLELPPIKLLASSLAKSEEEQTPLQEALNQLVRQLQRKDPSAFFSFPVTDFIAPGYSMIIKHPMDFSTMKEKIRNNEYQSIEELKDNFQQMCTNAMIYNKPETIYYKAAKKLLNSGMKILSQERIQSLKQSIDFMADLQTTGKQKDKAESQLQEETKDYPAKDKEESTEMQDVQMFKTPNKEYRKKEKDLLEDKLRISSNLAEREQEQIDRIIRDSAGKLTRRVANSQLEFVRRKPDGTTTLALLTPAEFASESGFCPSKLGAAAGRLQSGVNTLQGFKEDKRNKVTPVVYVNYGPFSSYAPVYDSTFANISKDDSDLIYSTYGEDSTLQGYSSIQEFVAKSQDHPYGIADSLLDALTNGSHSRTLHELEPIRCDLSSRKVTETEVLSRLDPSQDRFASLRAVTYLGIQEETFDSQEAEVFQRKLDETTTLLQDLQEAQNERLSTRPPPNMICLLGPSFREIQLAEKVTSNLKELAQQVTPGDIVSIHGIRKAMGISIPTPATDDSIVDLTPNLQETGKESSIVGGECAVRT